MTNAYQKMCTRKVPTWAGSRAGKCTKIYGRHSTRQCSICTRRIAAGALKPVTRKMELVRCADISEQADVGTETNAGSHTVESEQVAKKNRSSRRAAEDGQVAEKNWSDCGMPMFANSPVGTKPMIGSDPGEDKRTLASSPGGVEKRTMLLQRTLRAKAQDTQQPRRRRQTDIFEPLRAIGERNGSRKLPQQSSTSQAEEAKGSHGDNASKKRFPKH